MKESHGICLCAAFRAIPLKKAFPFRERPFELESGKYAYITLQPS